MFTLPSLVDSPFARKVQQWPCIAILRLPTELHNPTKIHQLVNNKLSFNQKCLSHYKTRSINTIFFSLFLCQGLYSSILGLDMLLKRENPYTEQNQTELFSIIDHVRKRIKTIHLILAIKIWSWSLINNTDFPDLLKLLYEFNSASKTDSA